MSIPPRPPEDFGIADPSLSRWLAGKLTPHPYDTYFDPLILTHPLGNGVPATYIACSRPLFPNTAQSREVARRQPHWKYLQIPTGHEAMLTMPEELTRMLVEVG